MLSKKKKVSRILFPVIIKESKSIYSPLITLRFFQRKSNSVLGKKTDKESKFSFVVSRKIIKDAVKRNRLKRRGYNIITKNKENIRDLFNCIFFFKKGAEKISFKELEKQVIFLLEKAGVYKKNDLLKKS